jgi:hypothetical protein
LSANATGGTRREMARYSRRVPIIHGARARHAGSPLSSRSEVCTL